MIQNLCIPIRYSINLQPCRGFYEDNLFIYFDIFILGRI